MSMMDYATRTHPRNLHDVLPSGSTPLERGIVYAYDGQPTPTVIETINDYDRLDARLLDVVAYGLNVDVWSSAWPESIKRQMLKSARSVQAKKGTLAAIRATLQAMGQGDAQILERVGARHWDDGECWDNRCIWGDVQSGWALFAIRLKQPVTDAHGKLIIEAVSAAKPIRCHLVYLDFAGNQLRWDSEQRWDTGFTWDIIAA